MHHGAMRDRTVIADRRCASAADVDDGTILDVAGTAAPSARITEYGQKLLPSPALTRPNMRAVGST
jgi:hypothetical protein